MENWHLTEKWYFVKTDIMAFFHSMQKGCIFNAQNGVNCIEFSEALPF